MHQISRLFHFDYGHRVLGHEGKCRFIHGHRGVAEVTVTTNSLNSLGMVVDFSKLKDAVGGWIDDNWDHNFLCHADDPLLGHGTDPAGHECKTYNEVVFGGRKPYVMKEGNPTAENMAKELYNAAKKGLAFAGMEVVIVKINETPNCSAEYYEGYYEGHE